METDNWDDYRFILAVVEHGSLNAAARSLGVNHATVLRRVTGFQERHNLKIFDRARNGYRLRTDQSGLVDALRDLRRAMETTERAVTGQGAGVRGAVRITSTDSLCQTILPDMIAGLQRAHPELKLDVLASNLPLNFDQLEAEVTVRPADSLPDELIGEQVAKMGFGVYGHKDLTIGREVQNWLGVTGPLLRSCAGKWQQSNVDDGLIVGSADSFITLRGLCAAGLGLAVLPRFLTADAPDLRLISGFFDRMETAIWVANHKDLASMPRIQACREFLTAQVRDRSALLAGDQS
ncbi:LysR family transcriptional regulator [Neptunicoccus cionae]|uniref:Transcriptional regulator n=1 Tax=Neptunicoccus cionae TaxID=2035344 RepID=A0A916QYS1_9RHOB|nr:LysR family transcriptional regulator [Amylibacter cionae]GGA20654.1 transcriptional regulator [Amylibacter cionae]